MERIVVQIVETKAENQTRGGVMYGER